MSATTMSQSVEQLEFGKVFYVGVISKYFWKGPTQGHFFRPSSLPPQSFSCPPVCLSLGRLWKCVFNSFSKQNTHIKAALIKATESTKG